MFDYSNDLPQFFAEIDDDFICDNIYTGYRKSSFTDLLSDSKRFLDYKIEDLANLDALMDGSTSTEHAEFKPEQPIIHLLIDDFSDAPFLSQNLPTPTYMKIQQKVLPKTVAQAVGTLSVMERQKKIDRYLEKKKKRTWVKRIHYDCRKKVADNRLRIKGRFVTRNKAFDIVNDGGSK